MTKQNQSHSDKPEYKFRHHTSTGTNGEILYDIPVKIKNQADFG